jgi:F0F1-type ATP synthase membrane subunit b/b'
MQSTVARLRQEVVDLAAQKAEEIISKGLTDKDQDNLVNEFIERVGRLH